MQEALGDDELASLLEKTSRTFALAIPLLPPHLARQVGAAYLVFRLADTLEDAPLWKRDARLSALRSFERWLAHVDGAPNEPLARSGSTIDASRDRAHRDEWLELVRRSPPTNDACLELVARADAVLATVLDFEPAARDAILSHARRTTLGMADFVARQDDLGSIALRDVDDLKAYCYAVAGFVGEMLTELFVIASPSLPREELASRAAAFGEGLQLVNILKDASSDAKEGRAYLPPSIPRAEIGALARRDLERASGYVALLGDDPAHAFCELPVRLAVATLDRLDEGAPKLARDEVRRIHEEVTGRSR